MVQLGPCRMHPVPSKIPLLLLADDILMHRWCLELGTRYFRLSSSVRRRRRPSGHSPLSGIIFPQKLSMVPPLSGI